MPNLKVTADAAVKIARWKKSGKSAREISALLEAQGIKLDQRTISRFVARSHDAPQPKPYRPAPTVRAPIDEPGPAVDEPGEPTQEPTLDEIEALERSAKQLQRLLAAPLPVRDTAALNAELRQTFASIRRARAAQSSQAGILSAEAQATLAKIRKFQAQNKAYPTPAVAAPVEPEPEDAPIPAATGTDSR